MDIVVFEGCRFNRRPFDADRRQFDAAVSNRNEQTDFSGMIRKRFFDFSFLIDQV